MATATEFIKSIVMIATAAKCIKCIESIEGIVNQSIEMITLFTSRSVKLTPRILCAETGMDAYRGP
jgi:hypothetical protein